MTVSPAFQRVVDLAAAGQLGRTFPDLQFRDLTDPAAKVNQREAERAHEAGLICRDDHDPDSQVDPRFVAQRWTLTEQGREAREAGQRLPTSTERTPDREHRPSV